MTTYEKPAELPNVHFDEFRSKMVDMTGKTVVITGCTTGTGFIAARVCGELGAKVFMLNRASSRSESALSKLKQLVPTGTFELIPCDLMSFESVRAAGAELNSKLDKLDVLCCNAGIMATKDEATKDGCDTQMQTNHLSHFLLTSLVWNLLEKSEDPRVVNHSSGARLGKKLQEKYLGKNGGNLGGDKAGFMPFSGQRWKRYQQTKLANLVYTYALRDRQTKVKVLVAHPGLAATNLQVTTNQDGGMGARFTNFIMTRLGQSGEDGTMGLLRGINDPSAKSGDFFGPLGKGAKSAKGKAEILPPGPEEKLADKASRDMLWKVSKEVTGATFPFE